MAQENPLWGAERIRSEPCRIVKEYVDYFNRARPPQGVEQKIPETSSGLPEKRRKAKLIAFPVLNGLHYDYRLAA
jgi:hypothetical protein